MGLESSGPHSARLEEADEHESRQVSTGPRQVSTSLAHTQQRTQHTMVALNPAISPVGRSGRTMQGMPAGGAGAQGQHKPAGRPANRHMTGRLPAYDWPQTPPVPVVRACTRLEEADERPHPHAVDADRSQGAAPPLALLQRCKRRLVDVHGAALPSSQYVQLLRTGRRGTWAGSVGRPGSRLPPQHSYTCSSCRPYARGRWGWGWASGSGWARAGLGWAKSLPCSPAPQHDHATAMRPTPSSQDVQLLLAGHRGGYRRSARPPQPAHAHAHHHGRRLLVCPARPARTTPTQPNAYLPNLTKPSAKRTGAMHGLP